MRNIFAFLPRGFSSLADYISPAAFDVVDWKAAIKKSARISKELLIGGRIDELRRDLGANGLPRGVLFANGDSNINDSANDWPVPGERLLELYFRQILGHNRAFLDLRADRFETDRATGVMFWRPNGLWVSFHSDFLQGMRLVYSGFYGNDGALVQLGLRQLGLTGDHLDNDGQARLLGLLEEHFGAGRNGLMQFKISHFMESFDSLFLFLRDKRIKLSEDFLFLGVMLLTLYLHLESLGEAYDVRAAFMRALDCPNPSAINR